jgi:hypothetical protein
LSGRHQISIPGVLTTDKFEFDKDIVWLLAAGYTGMKSQITKLLYGFEV